MEVEGRSNEAPHDVENPNSPVADLKRRLDSLSRRSSDEGCIYRVPLRLRGKNNSYTPEVVSIGPIHHDNKELEAMEEYKQRYLQYFLHRNNKVSLEYYVEKIKAQEDKLRGCYGNAQHFKSSDKFVSIILVDAAFVIELLLRYYFEELRDDNDWIFKKPWMLTNIVPDMLLLENQLPFVILEVLFDTLRVESAERPSMIKLSHRFFKKVVGLQRSQKDRLIFLFQPHPSSASIRRCRRWKTSKTGQILHDFSKLVRVIPATKFFELGISLDRWFGVFPIAGN
ncbi:UPF0481 protein At3g47200-like [Prunus avium]|uniref:UPF0481 protein At3g47200-like n=1 Tax=Prunus avium TaxID=42229 RepID=A0A6P5RGE1_PRUAV|nr:UPF0481 protein At3g47200-like [Prunus avium]